MLYSLTYDWHCMQTAKSINIHNDLMNSQHLHLEVKSAHKIIYFKTLNKALKMQAMYMYYIKCLFLQPFGLLYHFVSLKIYGIYAN